ncbi:MAG: DUF2442 domain-containing protein [Bacteroidota bacterium]
MKAQPNIEGFINVTPKIKLISFRIRGKVQVTLADGRIIIMPVSAFPSIKKLSLSQRKKWYLFGNGFSFDDCDEVYHIEQILGIYDNYRHESKKQAIHN